MTILTVNAGSHSLHLANVDRDVVSARLDRSDPPDSVGVADAVDDFLASHEPPNQATAAGVRNHPAIARLQPRCVV